MEGQEEGKNDSDDDFFREFSAPPKQTQPHKKSLPE